MINKWVNENNNRWLEIAESMRPTGIKPVFSNKYHTLMPNPGGCILFDEYSGNMMQWSQFILQNTWIIIQYAEHKELQKLKDQSLNFKAISWKNSEKTQYIAKISNKVENTNFMAVKQTYLYPSFSKNFITNNLEHMGSNFLLINKFYSVWKYTTSLKSILINSHP